MDPTACLRRILDAIEDGDRDEAIAAMEDLCEWLRKGGEMPEIPPAVARDQWVIRNTDDHAKFWNLDTGWVGKDDADVFWGVERPAFQRHFPAKGEWCRMEPSPQPSLQCELPEMVRAGLAMIGCKPSLADPADIAGYPSINPRSDS